MNGMLEECRKTSGSNARFVWVSDQFLKEAQVAGWSELPLWLPAEHTLSNFFSVDFSKARASGLTFRPLTETIRATLDWDSTRPGDLELRSGLKRERERELLQAWRELQGDGLLVEASTK